MIKVLTVIMSIFVTISSMFGINIKQKGFLIDKSKLDDTITSCQNERISTGKITGTHIVVCQNSEKVFDKTFGKMSVNGEDMRSDAVYRIASMTKPITAVALLIEQQRGHLDIYDDVSDYLPTYKEMYVGEERDGKLVPGKKAENSIKLYQLVSHTSGIGSSLAGDFLNTVPEDMMTCRGVADYYAGLPLDFEPGTSQAYSTAAFDVAAAVIEITSGMEFSEYLKKNIFDKLGMKDTTFEPDYDQWNRMVAVHNLVDGKAVDVPAEEGCVFAAFPVTYHMAGGGLVSTAEDYVKFAEMLLNNGTGLNGEEILKPEMVELMKTPAVSEKIMGGSQRWGLGVRVIVDNKYTLPKGSFGWSGAYGTHFWVDPVNSITAVYMRNTAYDGGAGTDTLNELEENVMDSLSLKLNK